MQRKEKKADEAFGRSDPGKRRKKPTGRGGERDALKGGKSAG